MHTYIHTYIHNRVNDETFKFLISAINTELLTLKLFEIFTHAVKPFFVNAQSMLKWFSVHVKNGMQPNLIIVLQKSYSQSVTLKVKTNKHVYSPLSYLLCVFFISCCICHITNHFCKKN